MFWQDLEEFCPQWLILSFKIIINMDLIYPNCPNSKTYLSIKLILIILTIVGPALMHSVPAEFSVAYIQMVENVRNKNDWWKTCRMVAQSKEVNLYSSYASQSSHSNKVWHEPSSSSQIYIDGQSTSDQGISFFQAVWIIWDELQKQLKESWEEIRKSMVKVEQNARSVEYDDNFASLNGGAIILRKSSARIHNAQAILEDNTEKYLYSDQKLPLELIIALKEEVKIQRISIKSNEAYSSIVRSFILEGALNQHEDQQQFGESKVWFKILSTQAKNSGQQQQFRTKIKAVKFLRLRIISKYGDWKYFTMTQLKVYGSGLFTQALVDYQTVKNSMPEMSLNQTQIEFGNQIKFGYRHLNSLEHHREVKEQKKEEKQEQNLLTFLLQKVNKLSRNSQYHILHMKNMSQRLENITKMEKQFRQHKNQYDAKNNFQEKYKQHRKVEQRIELLQQSLKKCQQLMWQFKYNTKVQQSTEVKNQCPNRQGQGTMIIFYVVLCFIGNIMITVAIGLFIKSKLEVSQKKQQKCKQQVRIKQQ